MLEVLQLLEGEVKLREQTRVAEQARPAVTDTEHVMTANRLSEKQHSFNERMNDVVRRILELPDAESEFDKEIGLLNQVSGVMAETTEILVKPETGPPAIAAETEIIELLLKSKRFNPNAGGGGGADPGGGGSGDTETPAFGFSGLRGERERTTRGTLGNPNDWHHRCTSPRRISNRLGPIFQSPGKPGRQTSNHNQTDRGRS